MLPLESTNPSVVAQYEAIMQAILREIDVKKVSITDFCADNAYDTDLFLETLNNAKEDFSYYLEVLEKLKNYGEGI